MFFGAKSLIYVFTRAFRKSKLTERLWKGLISPCGPWDRSFYSEVLATWIFSCHGILDFTSHFFFLNAKHQETPRKWGFLTQPLG